MTEFEWKAWTQSGEVASATIVAEDAVSAARRLKAEGLTPISVEPVASTVASVRRRLTRAIRVSEQDLLIFTKQVSALLSAGLPLEKCLVLTNGLAQGKRMGVAVSGLLKRIREGSSLSEAMRECPQVFPEMYVSTVRAGEESGVLALVFERLSESLSDEIEIRGFMRSSLLYPAVFSVVAVLSMLAMLVFAVPRFEAIFSSFRRSMPLPTMVLIQSSRFVIQWWWVILALLIGAAGIFLIWSRSPAGRERCDQLKLRAPVLGELHRKSASARFARTLATLVRGGVPLLRSLQVSKSVLGNCVMMSAVDRVCGSVREGGSVGKHLSGEEVFPEILCTMVAVGEETGDLERMVEEAGNVLSLEARSGVKNLLSLVEPATVIVMALIVSFIVMAMLLPVMQLSRMVF